MKVEQVNKEDEGFKPIVLTLTIESEEELLDLWSRCSATPSDINDQDVNHKADWDSCQELFELLDSYVTT